MSRTRLSTDKLCFTIPVPPSNRARVISELSQLAIDGTLTRVTNAYSSLRKSYRQAYMYAFGPEQHLFIQVDPHGADESETQQRRGPSRRFMRIEWNPNTANRCAPDAGGQVIRLLHRILPGFTYTDLFTFNVTRIDLAFDVPHVPLDSLLVLASPLRVSQSDRYCFNALGRTISVGIGLGTSDKYLYVYDKAFESYTREIRGLPGRPGQRRTGSRIYPALTRFELRLRDVGSLHDLMRMPNPFASYTVKVDVQTSLELRGHRFLHFADSCRLRGAYPALSAITDRRERTMYRDAIQEIQSPSFFDTDQIWSELPAALLHAFGNRSRR